jgi:hypothetical protein
MICSSWRLHRHSLITVQLLRLCSIYLRYLIKQTLQRNACFSPSSSHWSLLVCLLMAILPLKSVVCIQFLLWLVHLRLRNVHIRIDRPHIRILLLVAHWLLHLLLLLHITLSKHVIHFLLADVSTMSKQLRIQ